MNTIILAIQPKHVEKIMKGEKKYEFRKTICRKNVDTILFYATRPIKLVVGEAKIDDIIIDSIENIWERTKEYAGISYCEFINYYDKNEKAVVYKLKRIKKFTHPRKLEYYGIDKAPQSFQYLTNASEMW